MALLQAAKIVLVINVPSAMLATQFTIHTAVLLIVIHVILSIQIFVILSVLLDTTIILLVSVVIVATILRIVWNVLITLLVNNAPMTITYGKVQMGGRNAMNVLIIASIVRIGTLALHVNTRTYCRTTTVFPVPKAPTHQKQNPMRLIALIVHLPVFNAPTQPTVPNVNTPIFLNPTNVLN